jgi:hypothetical protein
LRTVRIERERRKNELHRVEGLDKKISLELQSLKEKVSAMTAEMNSFKSNEQLARDADEAKRALTLTKQKLLKQREAIKQQVAQLSAAQKKRELVCSPPLSQHVAIGRLIDSLTALCFDCDCRS